MQKIRLFVDVETTGIKSYSAHVVEAAAVAADESLVEIDSFHTMANPGEEAIALASPEALEVNRLSPDDIRRAPAAAEAAAAFRAFLSRFPGAQIHAFNNDFDLWFLAREPWKIPSRSWGECVMRAAKDVMGEANALKRFPDGKSKWPSLQEAAKFFGIPLEQTHRALEDARIATKVYREILLRRDEIAASDEADMVQEEGF